MSACSLRYVGLVAGLLLLGAGASAPGCRAQPDSVRAEIMREKGFSPDHSPRGALLRSVAVPGWGQLYNRQYYKIPFVYAGLAAIGARAYLAHEEYLLYKRAHLFGRGPDLVDEGEPNPYQQYQEQFNEATERLGGERLQAMRRQRDQFRRQRNLSVLGAGLFYALTVLDAYVSAHLLTFDVGEELSLRVRPTGRLVAATQESPESAGSSFASPMERVVKEGLGMRLQVRF